MAGTTGSADISPCGVFRWRLTRSWDASRTHATWIMLNPSTADAANDDPTIRRVRGFCERENWGGFSVVNLFPVRATDPADCRAKMSVDDGGLNPGKMREAIEDDGGPIVCAWGAHGWAAKAASLTEASLRICWPTRSVLCLGVTLNGCPRHPLYVRKDQPLIPFRTVPS